MGRSPRRDRGICCSSKRRHSWESRRPRLPRHRRAQLLCVVCFVLGWTWSKGGRRTARTFTFEECDKRRPDRTARPAVARFSATAAHTAHALRRSESGAGAAQRLRISSLPSRQNKRPTKSRGNRRQGPQGCSPCRVSDSQPATASWSRAQLTCLAVSQRRAQRTETKQAPPQQGREWRPRQRQAPRRLSINRCIDWCIDQAVQLGSARSARAALQGDTEGRRKRWPGGGRGFESSARAGRPSPRKRRREGTLAAGIDGRSAWRAPFNAQDRALGATKKPTSPSIQSIKPIQSIPLESTESWEAALRVRRESATPGAQSLDK